MPKLTEEFMNLLPIDGTDRTYRDTLLPGFLVRVTPAGLKILRADGSFGGQKIKHRIGYWPDIKVAPARELARQALADIREGQDPSVERRTRQQAAAAGKMTIADLAKKWLVDHGSTLKPRTVADYEKLLAKHILPALGHLTVAGITRDHITRLHVSMKATPRRANYVVSTVRAMLTFACDLKLRPPLDNPARKFKFYREGKRERFLTEEEIGKAAEAIEEAEREGIIGPHAAGGLRLALFTGARSGEVTAAKWSHIDWNRRIIRLSDSKTNEPRTIHLSDAAIAVLKSLPRIEPYIIAGALPGEPFQNLSRSWIVARAKRGLDDVRLHDLRHSFASLAVNRGVSLPMIGKLLGHRVPATTQRYAHLARDVVANINDDLGAAMTAAIAKHTAPAPSAKIIKLPKRRAHRDTES